MKTLPASLFCLAILSAPLEALQAQGMPPPGADSLADRCSAPMWEMPAKQLAARAAASTISGAARTKLHHDADADGTLWSRGANFKLRMDSSGTDFVPFLGSRAPHNFPVHLALAGATIAGEPVALDCTAAPERRGDVVTFDRGAIGEVYEIELSQVEQKFVVESLPAAGELALRVAVDTELQSSTVDDGFEFTNEFGRVHCGRATAIDARGRTIALASELDHGEMTIRLPASFVASASYPLVIDPIWFTVDLENGSATTLSPDAAHPDGAYLLVCWEEVFSATDHDVFAEVIDGGGGWYSTFYIDMSTENWARPRAGYVTGGNRGLIAAEVGAVGSRTVRGRVIQLDQLFSPVVMPTLLIADAASGETYHPEVGGDAFNGTPTWFCVVYERASSANDHDVFVQLVNGDSNLFGGATPIAVGAATDDSEPAISKVSNGFFWIVVWTRAVSSVEHDLMAAQVSFWSGGGTLWGPPIAVWPSSTDQRHPTVSGLMEWTNRFMVAWEQQCFSGPGCDYDIAACLVDDMVPIHAELLPSTFEEESQPAMEGNGRHCVCSYTRLHYPGQRDIVAVDLAPTPGSFLVDEYVTIAGQTDDDSSSRLVNHEDSYGFAGFSTVYFDLWNRDSDIAMTAYVGLEGGSMEPFCQQWAGWACPCGHNPALGGCPNSSHPSGATLNGSGASSTQNDSVSFAFADMPPNVNCLLFQGTSVSSALTFGDGMRCIGTPTIRFPMRAANGAGAAGYGAAYGDVPVSVRGQVPYVGGDFYYQVWYRDPASFCSPATTNLTNGMHVSWTP